ncbi:hypothetical protein [Ruminococcus sp. YE282]|uniref:hypothetical protein n=1 Tax=Ruminococcus sp. YE282 TaxID=3158780 RepID=UPI00088294AE|nr:hypothetical protein SAMN02910441_00235 [Ruminococcus bromii]
MKLALIKGIIIAVMFLAIASASIVAVNTPHPEVVTPDEASTPDQATIDEVTTTATVHMTTAKAIETTVAGTTKPTEPKPIEAQTTEPIVTEPQEEEPKNADSQDNEVEEVAETEPKEVEYLLDIDNPDPNYTPQSFSLSDSERYQIACVVMGEFGGGGFTGCALIAQSIRDAMAEYGYSASSVTSSMGYYGYNGDPNSSSYEAVDWIFDGNAAVQHRILYMNNSPGGWHGTQQYILDYQGVWFFDKW